jgi:hypothetical protein
MIFKGAAKELDTDFHRFTRQTGKEQKKKREASAKEKLITLLND